MNSFVHVIVFKKKSMCEMPVNFSSFKIHSSILPLIDLGEVDMTPQRLIE
jgi:hypothetical protein